jgi:hypothetical protein
MHPIRLLPYLLEDRELGPHAFVKLIAHTPSRFNLASRSHAAGLELRLARPHLPKAGRTTTPEKNGRDDE